MTNKNKITSQQEQLFHPESLEYRQSDELIAGREITVTYGLAGSYVDALERANHLVTALDSMSQRNQRDGLSVAAYTEQYSAPIWVRYQGATEGVLDGAGRNREKYHQRLRESFWAATGFAALRGMGLVPERQINPRAQKMWRDFNNSYGHPGRVKDRSRYKSSLQKQVDARTDEQLTLAA